MKTEDTHGLHVPQVLSEDLTMRGPSSIHRAVKLSGRYAGNTEEVISRMHPGAVTLDFFRSGKKARRFTIDATEADAFVAAWLAFKHDLVVTQEAERQRLHAVLEEARALVASLDGTIIPSHGHSSEDAAIALDTVYDLTLPTPWRHWNTFYALPDVVLGRVQQACEAARPAGSNLEQPTFDFDTVPQSESPAILKNDWQECPPA